MTQKLASIQWTLETEPRPLPPPPPTMMTLTAVTTTAMATTVAWVIGLVDQTGEDRANHRINSITNGASGTNQNTEDNLTNCRITRSTDRQGMAQLCIFADDD